MKRVARRDRQDVSNTKSSRALDVQNRTANIQDLTLGINESEFLLFRGQVILTCGKTAHGPAAQK